MFMIIPAKNWYFFQEGKVQYRMESGRIRVDNYIGMPIIGWLTDNNSFPVIFKIIEPVKPENNASDVDLEQEIQIRFTKEISPGLNSNQFNNLIKVSAGFQPVNYDIEISLNKIIIKPRNKWVPGTEHTLKISRLLTDTEGCTLEQDYKFSFTTQKIIAEPYVTPTELVSTGPASGHIDGKSDLSGIWEGTGIARGTGITYADKASILEKDGRVFTTSTRKAQNGDYITVADEQDRAGFEGEHYSSGTPRILEKVGSWVFSIRSTTKLNPECTLITSESDFADGGHITTTWRKVSSFPSIPEIGDLSYNFKGQVARGETIEAGELEVTERRPWLGLILTYPGSKLELSAISPSGTTFGRDSENVEYIDDIPAKLFIRNPETGRWKIMVRGVEMEAPREPFWVMGGLTYKDPSGKEPGYTYAGGGVRQEDSNDTIFLFITFSGGILLVLVMTALVGIRKKKRIALKRKIYEPKIVYPAKQNYGAAFGSVYAWFISVDGKHRLPIDQREITMGRSHGNAWRFEDIDVSGKHACLFMKGGRFFIRDLNSKNGVFVNGKKIVEVELKDKDRVKIGGNTFILLLK